MPAGPLLRGAAERGAAHGVGKQCLHGAGQRGGVTEGHEFAGFTGDRVTSGMPPTAKATLGQPKHMASRMLRQKLSLSEVKRPRSAACR